MSDERLPRLLSALSKQTAEGKIRWSQTASEGVYQVSFPKQSIQIRMRSNPNSPMDDVVISIRNDKGVVVESFADTDLPEFPDALTLMANLYERARRQALGADEAINDLLKELDEDFPF